MPTFFFTVGAFGNAVILSEARNLVGRGIRVGIMRSLASLGMTKMGARNLRAYKFLPRSAGAKIPVNKNAAVQRRAEVVDEARSVGAAVFLEGRAAK